MAIYAGGDPYALPIDMGAGDDAVDLSASPGFGGLSSLVAGGGGNDYIVGSGGDDRIWGDNYRSVSQELLHGSGPRFAGVYLIDNFEYRREGGVSGGGVTGTLPPLHGFFIPVLDGIDQTRLGFDEIGESVLIPDGALFAGTLEEAVAYLIGSSGEFDDYVDAGDGDDVVVGGSGSDEIRGGAGDDDLSGDYDRTSADAPRYDRLTEHFGTLAALFGRPGDDRIDGGEGNDILSDTSGGNDVLLGGDGDDAIESREDLWTVEDGASFHNVVHGGEGDDTIDLGNFTGGFDVVDGGGGDDVITVGAGHFLADGETSFEDNPLLGKGRVLVFGGEGNDILEVSADEGVVDGRER